MTLARRIIPCLDTDGARVVKGVNFVGLRDIGDPAKLAARYNAEGADELVVLDIAASRDRRPTFLETIRRVAAELAIPLPPEAASAARVIRGPWFEPARTRLRWILRQERRPSL